jgi:hypothetical protein
MPYGTLGVVTTITRNHSLLGCDAIVIGLLLYQWDGMKNSSQHGRGGEGMFANHWFRALIALLLSVCAAPRPANADVQQ